MRKKTRRTFTVETKHGLQQGHAVIGAKAPRTPRKLAESAPAEPPAASLWEAATTAEAEAAREAEPRRILPSLITWAPSEPEPTPALPPEPPLPRVRRVDPSAIPEVPRRRGRPRKVVPPVDGAAFSPEPPLPHVGRADPLVVLDAPRRRGRPRKVVPEPVVAAPAVPEAASRPAPAVPSPAGPVRRDRSETAGLPRGERWKRRLPRACW